ncbi:hypothetical protein NEIFL0001_0193 [Neisseria flavescens SK114]|nr:hypothetical protein NEIFL0001_0193 [Neisseria flavescens SK114]
MPKLCIIRVWALGNEYFKRMACFVLLFQTATLIAQAV